MMRGCRMATDGSPGCCDPATSRANGLNSTGSGRYPHEYCTANMSGERHLDTGTEATENSVMNDWTQCDAVERHPERVSGAWVFRGTRVPVRALFENLEDGASIDEFVEWFPGVTRAQVEAVLRHAEASLLAPAAA